MEEQILRQLEQFLYKNEVFIHVSWRERGLVIFELGILLLSPFLVLLADIRCQIPLLLLFIVGEVPLFRMLSRQIRAIGLKAAKKASAAYYDMLLEGDHAGYLALRNDKIRKFLGEQGLKRHAVLALSNYVKEQDTRFNQAYLSLLGFFAVLANSISQPIFAEPEKWSTKHISIIWLLLDAGAYVIVFFSRDVVKGLWGLKDRLEIKTVLDNLLIFE